MNDIDKIHDRIIAVVRELVIIDHRLTALESRPCNCSAASSAGSGGTDGCPSTSPQAPAASPAATGPVTAASASASDPVSAAIRADPKRPAWLTDEMLPLPEGTERLYRDRVSGYVGAYPCGRVWFRRVWAIRGIAEDECVRDDDEVYHVPQPASAAKSEPAGETAWDRWYAIYLTLEMDSERCVADAFNAWFASQVAAAKAKPHAETAEEVAWRIINNGGNVVAEITAAIKRERGEA